MPMQRRYSNTPISASSTIAAESTGVSDQMSSGMATATMQAPVMILVFISYPSVAAFPLVKIRDNAVDLMRRQIRPERVREVQLGIRRLPEEKV